MRHINGNNRENIVLIPNDFIGESDDVYFIDKFIEYLVLSNPSKYNRKTKSLGRLSFNNKIYLKLYLYSYLNGIRGSRSIERECRRNIELIWLLENLQPNYWSINNYRKTHKEEIESMTFEFRKFLKNFEYIKNDLIAYDGSKIKADAGSKNIYSIKKLEKKIDKIKETIQNYIEKSNELDEHDKLLEEYQKDKESYKKKYLELEDENIELKTKVVELLEKEEILNSYKDIIETHIKKKPKKRIRRKFPVKKRL